ncbi:MAG: tape measure protein, partial [Proteobacteria bacterium]|nr:tape measure protein [Pseudomonadota bacterium]
AKNAEADAVQQAADARREELTAIGPLTQAQQQELQVADNRVKALRVQAAAAEQSAKGLAGMGQAATQAGSELGTMRQAVDAKTAAIKSGLQVEKSEIDLQQQHLSAARAEAQARLQAAKAQGDEAAATSAGNALRQIEGDQLALVARAKRAEATAVQQAADARREELSAIGPLTQAQANELRAAENHAKALRTEAAAADAAAGRSRDLTQAHQGNAAATEQLSGRVQGLSQLLGQMAGALGAAFTFRELVSAAAQMEQLRSGLTAVTQDATKAGQELEFVRVVAGRIGADVTEVGKAFLGLSAATRGTAVEGEPTRQVFEAVSTAMGKAGKSSAETANALQALSQMASKGVVQSEELRGQLGEALPGALNAAAKGLGITTAELMKLVEEGKITAQDIFPALAQGLNELYGGAPQAQTLTQEITNIKNAFTEMADNIGQNGGLEALKWGAEVAQTYIVLLGDSLVTLGKQIGTVMGAVATLDFSGVKQAFADIEAESRDKLLKAAQHNGVLRDYIGAVGNEATKTALAQQQSAQAAAAAGGAAAKAGDDWIKLNNGYRLVLASVHEQIAEAEKSVIARDAEGKAAVALAAAFGTEAEQRNAQVGAAQANAAALQQLAQLRLTELEALKAQLKSLQDEAAAQGKVSEERSKQLAELQKQIGLRQQDADKAVAQAQASRLATAQAKAEAEAYKDNSARVFELRAAYAQAREELERVRAAKAAGKAGTEELTQAELAAGKAALLYRDALQDQIKAIDARARTQRTDLDLQAAGVQLAIQQQRTIMEVARARGDETSAMRAQESIRRMEIELLDLSAQAKYAEADAAIATAQAKKAELIASGEYSGVKKLEIEAAIKAAEVKRVEGQIAQETANRLRQLGDAQGDLKNKTEDATGSLLKQAGALERLGDGVQKIGSGYRNKDGFTSDKQGNVQQQFVWTRSSIIDYLKSAGLAQELAERLSTQFVKGDGTVGYEASDAQKQWGGKFSTLAEALGKMAEYYKYDSSGKHEAAQMLQYEQGKGGGKTTAVPMSPPAPTSAPTTPRQGGHSGGISGGASGAGGASFISNITINGQRETLGFADRQSQLAGEALMRQLVEGRRVAR